MLLHSHSQGQGRPLLILHGLFGSHKNWQQQARALATHFTVHTLDLRNHGDSFHSATMDYPSMAVDVLHWMDHHQLSQVTLLGHSMGGKVAMQIALNQGQRVQQLIVVDIAPKTYPAHHTRILQAMQALDLAQLPNRQAADQALQADIPDQVVRQFILTNLKRHGEQGFRWQLNLAGIIANYSQLLLAPSQQTPYGGDSLFIKGEQSDYIDKQDLPLIRQLFPAAQLHSMADTGHWPHAEHPQAFQRLVLDFLLAAKR